MSPSTRFLRRCSGLSLALAVIACDDPQTVAPESDPAPAPITNRIAVPPEVVENLGITFEEAGFGRLEVRLPVPGQLEAPESRQFTVRAPAAGRVSLRHARWDRVTQDELLAELHTPQLSEWLDDLADARRKALEATSELSLLDQEAAPLAGLAAALAETVQATTARRASAEALWNQARQHEAAARARLEGLQQLAQETTVTEQELVQARKDLVEAGQAALLTAQVMEETLVRASELQLQEATARARLENHQRLRSVAEQSRNAAQAAWSRQLRLLSDLTGVVPPEEPLETADSLAFHEVARIPVRAPSAGVLVEVLVSEGEWVEAGTPLVQLVDPSVLRFVGHVPEGDLAHLSPGATVRIEPAGGAATATTVLADLVPVADPATRTIRVLAHLENEDHALPAGLSATAWVQVEEGAYEEVLVSDDCLVQIGLEWICFRRDPADPNQVIRTPVSLGRRSAGWVEVLAGVGQGEQLVADGIHQLKETGVGTASVKGHFHADGTFHSGDE